MQLISHGARSSDGSISSRLMNPSGVHWAVHEHDFNFDVPSGSSAIMPPNLYFSYQWKYRIFLQTCIDKGPIYKGLSGQR